MISPTTRRPKVAIIGGQGKFGAALKQRLLQTAAAAMEIRATVDKNHNREVASDSDIVIVTVRPDEVRSVLMELRPALGSSTQIVSLPRVIRFNRFP